MPRHEGVAVVNTPTQLLFAFEAAHDLGLPVPDVTVIVVPTPGAREDALYDNLLRAAGSTDVRRLGPEALTRTGRVGDVLRLRREVPRDAWVLTAMVNYLPARALFSRARERAVVVDDGSWTLYLAERRQRGYRARTPGHAVIPFGRLPKALTFFTIYDDVLAGERDTVRRNTLAWTRSTFPAGPRGDHLVVLGSDLARAGYLTAEQYRARLAALRTANPGRAEYWPHRREDLDLATRLCAELDLDMRERRLPLEAEILACDPAPAVVATLPSTATRTLRLLRDLAGFRLVVSVPPESDVAPDLRQAYAGMARSAVDDADDVVG